jgi:hypothetical protein
LGKKPERDQIKKFVKIMEVWLEVRRRRKRKAKSH